MNKHIIVHTTHPAQEQTKRVCPAPADHNVPETPAQRKARLMAQAAANRIRVKTLGEGRYEVPSQRKGPDHKPVSTYLVSCIPYVGWHYTCPWAVGGDGFAGHGVYCEENEIALCSHIAQVLKHLARVAAETARAARRLATTCPRCGAMDALVFPFVCWHCGHKPALAPAGQAA